MAMQNAKVQTHIDAILKSEDCLIEDLTRMRESNENLQEQLEDAQKCISALMAQRSILLKEREELKQSKFTTKSEQSLSTDSEQNLSRTKHNNSFASAPNLSK
ncbi:hypothetical protein BC830DRAFT_64661 [Chytriomyces sp. MP71]|nr:hypothetical protein BC830DRAFT_64661 [Chytriomyces sp. MP71]